MSFVRSIALLALTPLLPLSARADERATADPRRMAPRALLPAEESELVATTRLDTVLRLALERNQDLAESRARTLAAEARRRAATRLPDLEAKYEQWGVPLARPFALDRSDTLMLGVRQSFPAWGSLDARGRAAAEEAGSAQEMERARAQEVAAQTRRTFAAYYRAHHEVKLHLEHAGITSRLLELARLNQRTGRGALQDVLRLELELTRLHTDIARIERELRSSRALLNALMDRPSDAPLGDPEQVAVPGTKDIERLEATLESSRPELGAAARAVRRSEATLDEMRRAARFPTVMVGVDYWYMPMNPEVRHGYGAMLSVNLPWLSGRRRDQEREAEETVRAEKHALESTRNAVRYELRDALARFEAARRTYDIIDQGLLAQSRRTFEATQAAYAGGQGDALGLLDALRSYLQVRIERLRALGELTSSEADVNRAAGLLAVKGGSR